MGNDLCEDGLGLVTETEGKLMSVYWAKNGQRDSRFISCAITVGGQLEGFQKLPLEVDGQLNGNLIARKDILCRHFKLVLSEREHATESDARVDDIMLSSRDNDEIVGLLEDSAVVCWDVQEERNDEFTVSSTSTSVSGHFDLLCPPQDGIGDFVTNDIAQMGLINDREDGIGADEGKSCEATVLDHEHSVLWVANDCGLILRDLNDRQSLKLGEVSVRTAGDNPVTNARTSITVSDKERAPT